MPSQGYRGTRRLSLAVVVCGTVLFPMLGSKTSDADTAMLFWFLSPVLVTLGLWSYANFYLKLARRGQLQLVWIAAEHDLIDSIRYITVLIAAAYLFGFFFDPNPG